MTGPRVVVADDQALVRTGFEMILKAAGVEVVGLAANGAEAVALVARLRPDVVLMDIRMPEVDGLEATRRILATNPTTAAGEPTRIIILTTFDLDRYVYAALAAGASGFLLKDVSAAHLANAVRLVATGDALLAPSITRRLVERYAQREVARTSAHQGLASLTARELEVLRHIARGDNNQEIAQRLHLSEATVKTHVTHILTKLALRDRIQAVVLAYESGLIQPGAQG